MCLQGARAAFEIIGNLASDKRLAVFIVWIDMLPADNGNEARRQAERMADPRVTHFHDGARRAGNAIAGAMGAQNRTAWDIYMIYPPGISWGKAAPKPEAWVHQILAEVWANPLRFRTGGMLKGELSRMIRACVKTDRPG